MAVRLNRDWTIVNMNYAGKKLEKDNLRKVGMQNRTIK